MSPWGGVKEDKGWQRALKSSWEPRASTFPATSSCPPRSSSRPPPPGSPGRAAAGPASSAGTALTTGPAGTAPPSPAGPLVGSAGSRRRMPLPLLARAEGAAAAAGAGAGGSRGRERSRLSTSSERSPRAWMLTPASEACAGSSAAASSPVVSGQWRGWGFGRFALCRICSSAECARAPHSAAGWASKGPAQRRGHSCSSGTTGSRAQRCERGRQRGGA